MKLSILYRRSVDNIQTDGSHRWSQKGGQTVQARGEAGKGPQYNLQCNQLSWKSNSHKEVYNKPWHRPLINP